MNIRTTLLAGASLVIFPISTPVGAQQGSAPAPGALPTLAPSTGTANSPAPTPAPPATTESGAGQASADEIPDEPEIVVVGTRPRGSVVGDIPPENTLDARDVRATGATNINELLDALAPQIGSTQGRGGEAPVLLLNGQRISSFREMRDIPTEAIQRVEILPEEVALKYGYSANQKVVNIVLRQRFRSTVAELGATAATEGGYGAVTGDLTRLMIQRNGRTQFNLHATGNNMLTENERNICLVLTQPCPTADEEDALKSRSLIGEKRDIRGSSIFNRQIGTVSATLNTEVEHTQGRSLIGLGDDTLLPLPRDTTSDTAHAGMTLNWDKAKWHWNVVGNADWAHDSTTSARGKLDFPFNRAKETSTSTDLEATTNGTVFKVPAGNASTTLKVGLSSVELYSQNNVAGLDTVRSLGRSIATASASLDLPISRRGHDFHALGNLTINGNAQVDQLSDFGTLTKVGVGANWSPVDRLNLVTSWTREDGPPTVNQLGDPLLPTPQTRIFDFTTGKTVLATVITGGSPNLQQDRRTVFKLGGYWQPFAKTDLRFRADYVHQRIDNAIANLTVTPQIEAAFQERFVRNVAGQLVSADLRPVNFDHSQADTLRVGFDFTKPLKSHRPSQTVLNQLRQQFGFGPRGGGQSGNANPQGAPPSGQSPEGASTPGGPPGGAGAGPSGSSGGEPRGGGGFGGGGRGGGRGGGFFGGGNGGRIQFSLTDTVTFVNKVLIRPGVPELDYLHGDALGQGGGTPRHVVQAQGGWFNNGWGVHVGANWQTATDVNALTGGNLHFSPVATFDLRMFANFGDMPEVTVKHPWLRGSSLRFDITNIFDSKPRVHDAAGIVPLNYQPDLLNPLGRTVMISFRKLFLPPASWFRTQFQQDRQRQQQQQSR